MSPKRQAFYLLLTLITCHFFLAQSASAASTHTKKYPWYILNPRRCTGPKLDRAVPLLASTSKSEVHRAGWSHKTLPWATPSNTCNYTGYYVGGGGGHCGGKGCRCPNDGTWGWDFQGHWIPRIVNLAWTRPRRFQGGTGQYKPDGPKFPSKTPENLFAPR